MEEKKDTIIGTNFMCVCDIMGYWIGDKIE